MQRSVPPIPDYLRRYAAAHAASPTVAERQAADRNCVSRSCVPLDLTPQPVVGSDMPLILERRQRRARKLDRQQAITDSQAGLSNAEIAAKQGVDPNTVYRFLVSLATQKQDLIAFRASRADVFADLQAKALNVQYRMLKHLDDDGVLASLTPAAKASVANVINNVMGTAYDKERLETGQSTSNVSVLGKLIDAGLESVLKPTKSVRTPKHSPQPVDSNLPEIMPESQNLHE